jgi:hypothetical protein
MVSIIPPGKDVSVIHLNADWGYLTYIEKGKDECGEPTYKVVRVSLGGQYGNLKPK